MGRAGSRLSRLARVRPHPRRTAFTGRPAPHPARPTNPTPPTELTTEPPNRHHTNRIRRHRIASQGAGPTSGHIYTGNGTPPWLAGYRHPRYLDVEVADRLRGVRRTCRADGWRCGCGGSDCGAAGVVSFDLAP